MKCLFCTMIQALQWIPSRGIRCVAATLCFGKDLGESCWWNREEVLRLEAWLYINVWLPHG
jgi:hypothetical protein